MLDLKRVRNAGLRDSDSTWIGRSLRRLIWPLVKPYFARLVTEMQQTGRPILPTDGWKKDLTALAHRLSSIEEALQIKRTAAGGAMRQPADSRLNQPPKAAAGLSSDPQTPSGYTPLMEGATLSLPGTSLVLSSSKFGRFLWRHPDMTFNAVFRDERWWEDLRAACGAALGTGGVAIEAGAQIGFQSICLSRHCDTVYSFEPRRDFFEILSANILLNDRRNVLAFNQALLDRGCEVTSRSPENEMAHKLEEAPEQAEASTPACTIDSLELDRVRLIKVSSEGAGVRVLMGAKRTIARCRPTIVVELEQRPEGSYGTEIAAYKSFLEEANYDLDLLPGHDIEQQAGLVARPR